MEQLLSGNIWQSQINGLQGYHTTVLQHQQACHCPSWCILKMPRCFPPSRWLPSCLCFQSSYTCGAALCQHRMWTAHLCLWSRMIPHLCLWRHLHNWEWQQASWTDQDEESGRYACLSTENAATTPRLRCHHQVLTWQRDAGCRCSLLICTSQNSKDTSRHHHQPCTHNTWQENCVQDSHPRWPTPLCPHWNDHCRLARWYQWCVTYSVSIPWPQKHPVKQLRMASSFEVKLSSFLYQKGRRCSKQNMKDTWESASAKTELDTVYTGLESTQTSDVLLNHAQHANITTHRNHDSFSSQHWPQNAHGNSSALTTSTLMVSEYLVVSYYYSKMHILRRIPACQCNASKPISVPKELFAEHGISEVLHSDNSPDFFANALFTEFATEWRFDHNTSSPRNPRSNGQAEAAMKTVKGFLTCAKCSGQGPYLALLAYHSTPIDVHLHSSAEMLHQQVLCTTVWQWIRHTDPHANAEGDQLNQHATQSAEYDNQQGCCKKPPFFAGQTVSVLNDTSNLWIPVTIIHKSNHGSYLVHVIGGGQYRHACDHISECHPDAVKPDTSNIGDVALNAST